MTVSDSLAVVWRKSSRSVDNGQCLEVAMFGATAMLRDSKSAGTEILTFPTASWKMLVDLASDAAG